MVETLVGKVLFVDNARDWRNVIAHLLRHEDGDTYSIASAIAEARTLLQTGEFEVVVADWRMPGDGVAFLREVRHSFPRVTCVLLTGFKHELAQGILTELATLGIHVFDKGQATQQWLENLVNPDLRAEALEHDLSGEDTVSVEGAPETVRDSLYTHRLLLNESRAEAEGLRKVLGVVAEDLLEELRSLRDRDQPNLIGPGRSMSVDDMVREIETGSELGRALLMMDRQVQKRLRGGKL